MARLLQDIRVISLEDSSEKCRVVIGSHQLRLQFRPYLSTAELPSIFYQQQHQPNQTGKLVGSADYAYAELGSEQVVIQKRDSRRGNGEAVPPSGMVTATSSSAQRIFYPLQTVRLDSFNGALVKGQAHLVRPLEDIEGRDYEDVSNNNHRWILLLSYLKAQNIGLMLATIDEPVLPPPAKALAKVFLLTSALDTNESAAYDGALALLQEVACSEDILPVKPEIMQSSDDYESATNSLSLVEQEALMSDIQRIPLQNYHVNSAPLSGFHECMEEFVSMSQPLADLPVPIALVPPPVRQLPKGQPCKGSNSSIRNTADPVAERKRPSMRLHANAGPNKRRRSSAAHRC